MSIKNKILNVITSNPKIVTFGIALGITLASAAAVSAIVPAYAVIVDPTRP